MHFGQHFGLHLGSHFGSVAGAGPQPTPPTPAVFVCITIDMPELVGISTGCGDPVLIRATCEPHIVIWPARGCS